MGIGFVLLIWAVLGTILSLIGATVFGCTAALLTRGAGRRRIWLIVAVSLFPFFCLGWAGAIFAFQAIINETFFDRDAGLGDTWRCRLPNGYAILMIDTTDHGFVYNPKTQTGGVTEQDDSIGGVRNVQVVGRYILGTSDSRWDASEDATQRVHSYFVLDTQLGTHIDFSTYESLQASAQKLGISVKLEPISTVYSRYRYTWFEIVSGSLLIIPPLIIAILLALWTIRIRKTRALSLQAT